MPHTIIDIEETLEIPENLLIWGLVRHKSDLEANSLPLSEVEGIAGDFTRGNLVFKGDGRALIQAYQHRMDSALKAGMPLPNETKPQNDRQQGVPEISYNTIQPYRSGKNKGLYPSIDIRP